MDYTYIRKQHKEHLVRDYFDDTHQWDVRSLKQDEEHDAIWVFSSSQLNYSRFVEGRHLYNQIQGISWLTNKDRMYDILRSLGQRSTAARTRALDFLPRTFILDLKEEAYSSDEQDFLRLSSEGMWIVKPTHLFGGKGIQLVKNLSELQASYRRPGKQLTPALASLQSQPRLVIQQYVANSLLVANKKFDIRCYLLIASTSPYYVLFHPGFIRKTLYDFDVNSDDLHVHLTNVEQQKSHPRYEQMKDMLLGGMDELEQEILKKGHRLEDIARINRQMREIATYLVLAAQPRIQPRKGQCQILGLDFLLDDRLKLYLIEVNKSPSWQLLHPSQ